MKDNYFVLLCFSVLIIILLSSCTPLENNIGFDPLPEEPLSEYCGDGFIQEELDEECDWGVNNTNKCNADYMSSCETCTTNCRLVTFQGGYCGDGTCQFVESYEDCTMDCNVPLNEVFSCDDNDRLISMEELKTTPRGDSMKSYSLELFSIYMDGEYIASDKVYNRIVHDFEIIEKLIPEVLICAGDICFRGFHDGLNMVVGASNRMVIAAMGDGSYTAWHCANDYYGVKPRFGGVTSPLAYLAAQPMVVVSGVYNIPMLAGEEYDALSGVGYAEADGFFYDGPTICGGIESSEEGGIKKDIYHYIVKDTFGMVCEDGCGPKDYYYFQSIPLSNPEMIDIYEFRTGEEYSPMPDWLDRWGDVCLRRPPSIGDNDSCGNEIVDLDEECDWGSENRNYCVPPYEGSCETCTSDCILMTFEGGYCGDDYCDGGNEDSRSCIEDCPLDSANIVTKGDSEERNITMERVYSLVPLGFFDYSCGTRISEDAGISENEPVWEIIMLPETETNQSYTQDDARNESYPDSPDSFMIMNSREDTWRPGHLFECIKSDIDVNISRFSCNLLDLVSESADGAITKIKTSISGNMINGIIKGTVIWNYSYSCNGPACDLIEEPAECSSSRAFKVVS